MEDTKKTAENVPSIQVYLAQKGVDEYTPESVIEQYKREHRRLYHQAYHKQRKGEQKRMAHRLTKEEYAELKRQAKAHNQEKLSPFMKACAFAYMKDMYLDRNPKQTEALIKEIRQIGNNINQVVQVMHSVQAYHEAAKYQHLKDEVTSLVALVKEQLLSPPKVGDYITELVEEHPPHLDNFEALLLGLKQKYGNQEQDTQG